jgi:hypothetical protein
MIFIETSVFTRKITELVDDESYAKLQMELASHPEAGRVVQGTGGIRKIRMAASGHGKRGGARVIYYYFAADSQIAMLLVYPKNVKDTLEDDEKKMLKNAIENWKVAK